MTGDPWRRYEPHPDHPADDDGEREAPRKRRSGCAVFLLGLPVVALLWIVAGLINAAT